LQVAVLCQARAGCGNATLIALYAGETMQASTGRIRVVPAWQWFLV